MTAYYVEGYNYNDYIRDYFESNQQLEKYISNFAKTDQTVENLITCIENNYRLEETNLTIQQALAKAKIITIGIGMDELMNLSLKQNIPSKDIEDYKKDMEKLLKIIRNFNNNEIYLIGLYKGYNLKDDTVLEINNALKEIANQNQIIFIDISDFPDKNQYYLLNTSYYINYKGHKEIANRILSSIY